MRCQLNAGRIVCRMLTSGHRGVALLARKQGRQSRLEAHCEKASMACGPPSNCAATYITRGAFSDQQSCFEEASTNALKI